MGVSSSGVVIGPLREGPFALTLSGLLPNKLKGEDSLHQKQNQKILDNSGKKRAQRDGWDRWSPGKASLPSTVSTGNFLPFATNSRPPLGDL